MTDPLIAAFLADGDYADIDAWMTDSDYDRVFGEWRQRDEDGGAVVDPEGTISGAIESVLSDPRNRSEYPLTFAAFDADSD